MASWKGLRSVRNSSIHSFATYMLGSGDVAGQGRCSPGANSPLMSVKDPLGFEPNLWLLFIRISFSRFAFLTY